MVGRGAPAFRITMVPVSSCQAFLNLKPDSTKKMASRGAPGHVHHAAPPPVRVAAPVHAAPPPPPTGALAGQKSRRRRNRRPRTGGVPAASADADDDDEEEDVPASAGAGGPPVRATPAAVVPRAAPAAVVPPAGSAGEDETEEMHPSFLSDVKFADIPSINAASMRGPYLAEPPARASILSASRLLQLFVRRSSSCGCPKFKQRLSLASSSAMTFSPRPKPAGACGSLQGRA